MRRRFHFVVGKFAFGKDTQVSPWPRVDHFCRHLCVQNYRELGGRGGGGQDSETYNIELQKQLEFNTAVVST